MLKKERVYNAICDGCGKNFSREAEITFPDTDCLHDVMRESEWHITSDTRHYCRECYSLDDQDNIVFNVQERYTPSAPEAESPWKKIKSPYDFPEKGVLVLGFHPSWKDPITNPNGICCCFWNGECFVVRSEWDSVINRYRTVFDLIFPTYWMPLPAPPSTEGGAQ